VKAFKVTAHVKESKEVFDVCDMNCTSEDEAKRKAKHYAKKRLEIIRAMVKGKDFIIQAEEIKSGPRA
jgi:hypothetical protein